jgi:hypothetical protein
MQVDKCSVKRWMPSDARAQGTQGPTARRLKIQQLIVVGSVVQNAIIQSLDPPAPHALLH